jgi:hypothetical protein
MSLQQFLHIQVNGKKFEKSTVPLDNMSFTNCRFIDCTVFYSGGPVEVFSCSFEGTTRWEIQGAASLTMEALRALGWGLLPPAPIEPGEIRQ